MDIEEFYDSDPRRRSSAEVELGTEWRDASDVRYELSWVRDTGELYVMREPVPQVWEDPFGDALYSEASVDDFTVSVVGLISTHDQLEDVLAGWQDAIAAANGIEWLASRLRERGIPAPGPADAVPPGGEAGSPG